MFKVLRLLAIGFLAISMIVGCDSSTSGPNRPPMANAGPDQVGTVEVPVTLDGRASFDPDGDRLSYRCEVAVAPPGANVGQALPDKQAQEPEATLVPDRAGLWLVQLVVSDGRLMLSTCRA